MHLTSASRVMSLKPPVDHDLDLLLVTDSVSAALEHIQRHTMGHFGLTRRPRRPSILLGEPRTSHAVAKRPLTRPSPPPIAPTA